MSNRRKLRGAKVKRRRCTQCRGKEFQVKVYDDADLFICRDCQYPVRVERVSP